LNMSRTAYDVYAHFPRTGQGSGPAALFGVDGLVGGTVKTVLHGQAPPRRRTVEEKARGEPRTMSGPTCSSRC
jgi:hypothetical protein